jgi:hypothetical protein
VSVDLYRTSAGIFDRIRLRAFVLVAASAAAAASPADAQRALVEPDGEGVIMPKMSYPAGKPAAIARMTWNALRYASRQERCHEVGCLILINDSANYRLQEFYVRPTMPRAADDWGPNQIDQSLAPHEATVRFKLADQRFCKWPVKFVLRHRKTKEVFPVETSANLCATPNQDTVLRVRIVKPDVYVDG